MVVATHGPDICAAVVPEMTEMAKTGFQQIGEAGKEAGHHCLRYVDKHAGSHPLHLDRRT